MRVAKKRCFPRPHAFLRLNEDAKRPPGVRDILFIDEDGRVLSIEKMHLNQSPLPFCTRLVA